MPWSGPEFLGQIGGTAADYSPARVVFLAQRLAASGRLWLTEGADIRTIDFADGRVVGCAGFPDLLSELGVSGERADGLSELVGRAVSGGHARDDVLARAANSLGSFIVASEMAADLMVQFALNAPGPADPIALPLSPVEMVRHGVGSGAFLVETRAWMLVEGGAAPVVNRPTDSDESSWSLGDEATQLLSSADDAAELRDISVEGDAQWHALAALRIMGILGVVQPEAAPVAPAAPEPEPNGPPAAASKPVAANSPRGRFDRPHTESAGAGQPARPPPKKRRRLSRTEVLSRSPWDSPTDKVEYHLKVAYEVLGASRPEAALLIRKTEELESEVIEQRYRDACARYHPDRYLGSSQAVRALAEGCFGRISEAYHLLKDPVHYEQAKERLVFRETGKRPVNDKTRARARVDFKRAEMRFRQRRYDDAAKAAGRAIEGDPGRWEYQYLHLRSAWHAGAQNTDDVVTGILAIEGMDSTSRGEALYIAGEMYLKDGRNKEAYGLFKQAVDVDPENVGARRRIRLKQSRTRDAEKSAGGTKKASKPLFGGLFGRRGD